MGRQAEALVSVRGPKKPPPHNPFTFLASPGAAKEPVSLLHCDAETMRDGVAFWLDLGHAITFGMTSDGGAVAITLLAGGHRASRYFTDIAALEEFLLAIRDEAKAR